MKTIKLFSKTKTFQIEYIVLYNNKDKFKNILYILM